MSWRESRVVDIAVDVVVYKSATHGEHAGKLSCLLTTRHCDVFGFGMNTLVTNAIFNRNYPMQEGSGTFVPSWVKVEKLSEHSIRKIVIGHGCGAAVTRNHELLTWGKGVTTYLPKSGIEIVELYNPETECRFCNTFCADYGRKIGNTWFSYCKQKQTLVTFSATSPPPDGVQVKRLGNRKYGALACSTCMTECDMQVMENHSFNFCNNCNALWDLDENERPMNFMSVPLESFLRRLSYPGRIRDVTYGRWGFWVLTDSSRLVFSGFFLHSDTPNVPIWWRQTLAIPHLRLPHKIISTHSSKTDVFVITDKGVLYKRVRNDTSRTTEETHMLERIPLDDGVRKMCCGRFASLCLLDDGTLWILYSQKISEASQSNAEKIKWGKVAKECLDVAGITRADLFYVQTIQKQEPLRMTHPAMDSVLIEIIFGELNCTTFLWHFSDHCRIWSEGKISYDPFVTTQLINRQLDQLPTHEGTAGTEDDERKSPTRQIPSDDITEQATALGLGFPVQNTLWSSWGSTLIRKVATGGRCLVEGSRRVYRAIFAKIKPRSPVKPAASERVTPPANLPPFQSSLYGKQHLSDITLQLQDGNLPAHRVILCSTSKFFKMQLAEGGSNVSSLDLRTYNPKAYRCLLKYYYQMEPDDLKVKDLLDLLILATTYKEHHITGEIEEKIKSKINVDNVTTIMEVAKEYSFNNLVDKCELFERQNPTSQEKDEVATTKALTPTTSTFAKSLNQ